MKLGESGEAFFVQECHEKDFDELPANLATSPLPSEEFSTNYIDRYEWYAFEYVRLLALNIFNSLCFLLVGEEEVVGHLFTQNLLFVILLFMQG